MKTPELPEEMKVPEEAVEAAIDVICAPLESKAPGWVDEHERESVRRQVVIVLQAALPAILATERERVKAVLEKKRDECNEGALRQAGASTQLGREHAAEARAFGWTVNFLAALNPSELPGDEEVAG